MRFAYPDPARHARRPSALIPILIALLAVSLCACGGGGGGSELDRRFRVDDPDRGAPVANSAFAFDLENLDLELQGIYRDLEDEIEAGDLDAVAARLTDGFRGSVPGELIAVPDDEIADRTIGPSEIFVDGPDAFRAGFERYLDQFDQVYESFLKAKEYVDGGVFENRVEVKIKQDLRGHRKDGAIHQEKLVWRCSLRKDGDTWKFDRAFVISRHETASRRTLFTDITRASGLALAEPPEVAISGFRNLAKEGFLSNYDYGGVCVYDVDGDDRLDIFLPNAFGSFALFMNRGNGKFVDEAAVRGITVSGAARGAVFGDVDNDGDADLFVCRAESHHLKIPERGNLFFENTGSGQFRERTKEAGLAYEGPSMTPVMLDYDNDGDLDILVANYGSEIVHHPFKATNGERNLLYRNDGKGRFTEVGKEAGLTETYWSYAIAVCDWNNDRYPDFYVANDYGRNHFYVNGGDGTFEERAAEVGIEDVGNGMGATFVDWNRDGAWDLYVTNMQSATGRRVLAAASDITRPEDRANLEKLTIGNTFFEGRSDGKGFGANRAIDLGIADAGWAWHGDFADFDADGDDDLVVVNGYYSARGKVDC